MRLRVSLLGAGSLLAVAACGLDTSGTMSDAVGDDGGAVIPDGGGTQGADGGLSFDASPSDGAMVVDSSPPPPTDACAPSAEICNDGIDNDCNGLADCADPACSAKSKCEPPIANGWTLVAYDATTADACPQGYGNPTDVVSITGSAQQATCGCACSLGTPPSCVSGSSISVYTNGQQQCPIGPAPWFQTNGAGGCVDFLGQVASKPGSGARVTPLGPSGGSCTATPSNPPPPPPPTAHGRVCSVQGSLGGGCPGGGVCAPVVSGAFAICVQANGDVACPSGYPSKSVVGTSVQDTRACSGSCTCGAPTATCANAKLSLFANTGCTGHQLDLTADDKCDTVNDSPNNNYSSWKYQADAQLAACGNPTSTPTPSGGVSLQNARTICCP